MSEEAKSSFDGCAFESSLTLEEIRRRQAEFAAERDSQQYHTPRNLVLALTGEVGELSEIFMWRADSGSKPGLPDFTAAERTHVGEELSDCLLYLIRLADRCGVDLSTAVLDKIAKNSAKYPKDKVKGSSAKYSAYTNGTATTTASADQQAAAASAKS